MPVHNVGRYVRETISSVLRQTFRDFEFVIINDGSSDDTEDIILSYDDERIKYFRNEENKGLIYTLNKGLDLAEGEYIARIDGDDIAIKEWLEYAVKGFKDAPYASVVNQRDYEMTDDGKKYRKRIFFPYLSNDALRFSQLFATQILHPGIVVKAEAIKRYKYRDAPETLHREDFDLWRRMLIDNLYIKTLSSYVIYHRRAKNSITSIQRANLESVVDLMLKDVKSCGFNFDRSCLSFFVGEQIPYSTNISQKTYKEFEQFFSMQKESHNLMESDYNGLLNWAKQNVTNRTLHECMSHKNIFGGFLFLLTNGIFFSRWFWCNLLRYMRWHNVELK